MYGGRLTKKAKKALLEGDINQIGNLMNQNHKLLQEITVSGKINDELVKISIKSGAVGAKLTGTGRGGLVIALAEDQHTQEIISHSIEKAGYTAWKTVIGWEKKVKMKNKIIILKLGGSLLTEKADPFSIRDDIISKSLDQIIESKKTSY